MLAVVIIDTILVVLLAGLVAGLLRSHTEILRAVQAIDERLRRAEARANDASGATMPAAGAGNTGPTPTRDEAEMSRTSVRLRTQNAAQDRP